MNSRFDFSDDRPWEFNFGHSGFGLLIDGPALTRGDLRHDSAIGSGNSDSPHCHHITTAKALAMFLKENPSYHWEISHGMINILPNDMNASRFKPLLKKIHSFSTRQRHFDDAANVLLRQEGITIHDSGSIDCMRSSLPPPLHDYSCKSGSVLDCLNEMAAQDHFPHWQIQYRTQINGLYAGGGCGGIGGSFW